MANINSIITYNANLSPAQAQIKALTGQVAGLTAAFNSLDASALKAQRSLSGTFAANVGQIGGFTAQTVKATSSVENFGRQLAANKLTMREYFREAITGYTRQNSLMRQLAEQQVRYQQSIAVPTGGGQAMMLTPQAINASSNAAQLASQRFSIFNQLVNGGATAMLNWGKNTQWAGRQLMVGFTLPLALFAGVMSKQFRELDKELTRFQKVYGSDLGNAVSESTQRMREQVQQLAYDISSAYGIAAKETAALAADIAATGREGEDLMASVQQTTRLAVLGEVDRQEAMKATLSLQSAFRMNTNELAESINFLNAVENQTSATLEDLATAIPKVGPVIRSLGGDVKDLATLLVAMREGGIPAAEAANALKSGLASLINPTKQASEVAKQFGVDLVGIVEANRGQLMPTIYAMQEALGGLDSFSRSRIIEQIFGKYQFARISALFDNIGRTGSQTQSVIELATKSSAELAAVANGEIRTLTESTAVKFQRTLEQLKNSLMPIAQTLTETLIPVLEKVGEGVKMFSTFFSSLPESVKGLAKWGVALTALAGPVIMLVGLFGNLIANGLKFGMMIVRLGAKMAGIKTEKFQLLDENLMAAKLGVDNLTSAFTTQEVAMKRLVGVLAAYEQSLARMARTNPALFIPGAVPGARGVVPIKRQKGSTAPERVPGGYGGGDRIPALLEPGESVITKEATAKFWPVIEAMNRGNLPGFNRGTIFLGMPRGYKDIQQAKQVRQTLSTTNVEATTGRFAQLPITDVGQRVTSIGGRSSSIPGVNGIYEQGGKKYVVKTHDTADSALAEVRGTQLTRDVFGLKTPVQELIKMKHPVTGDVIFAVRSPYDAKFAKSTGVIDEKNFFGQALAAIVRRDKDLQPDNLYGNIVTDVGQAFVANKASQPRTIGGAMPSVAEQTEANFLMSKGGARKWFAETTAPLARTMSEDDYVRGFQTTIAEAARKARGAIDNLPYMTKEERMMYGRIIDDLDEAAKIDWRAVYQFHRGITPEIKRPPTAAAIAKKEALEAEKARQRGDMARWEYGLPYRFQKGGKVPGGYGGGDKVPAYLEPGEFVITKEATKLNKSFLEAINSGKKPGMYKTGKDTAGGSGQGDISRAAKLHTVPPDELGRMYYGSGSKSMLGVLGYGGLTTTLHPQYLNNTFDKLTGVPSWMKAGIPFNDRAAAQMLSVLIKERDLRGGKVGPEFTRSIQYLQKLIKSPGKARSITLNGYAATTAAAERLAGIIPDTDKAQKARAQQLAAELNKRVGATTSPGRIFSTINRLSMEYIDRALADPNARKLIWQSTPGTSKTQFKDSLRERLPRFAQSGFLFRGIRLGRFQKGGVGSGEPALLEPGEFVVNSDASAQYAPILRAMNRGTLKGYEDGRDPVSLRPGYNPKDPKYSSPDKTPTGGRHQGHIFGAPVAPGIPAFGKNLQIGGQAVFWHADFWKMITAAENQLANVLAMSAGNRARLMESLNIVGPQLNASQQQIDRIMLAVTNGFMQHEDDVTLYQAALKNLGQRISTGAASVTGSMAGLIKQVESIKITGYSAAEAKAVETRLITEYQRILNTPGKLAEAARIAIAKQLQLVQQQMTTTGIATTQMTSSLAASVQASATRPFPGGVLAPVGTSPLAAATAAARTTGPSVQLSAAEQNLIKAIQLRESIARKAAASEGLIENMNAERLRILNDTKLTEEKRRTILQQITNDLALEEANRDRLREAEQRADRSVIAAKERAARAWGTTATNATAAMTRPGGIYGPGGYDVFGTVGKPSTKTPDWLRTRMDQAARTGPGPILGIVPALGVMPTGPDTAMKDPMQKMMRGQGLMNVAFMGSMLVGSLGAMGGATEEVTSKLMMLSMALMALPMLQMMNPKGMATNFLGLTSAGKGLTSLGARAAGPAAAGLASSAVKGTSAVLPTFAAAKGLGGMGGGLMMAGRAVSLLGGPVGIAAGLGITAAITGFMMYRNAAEEARERAIAAFNDPVKSAEYFGESVQNVADIIEKNKLANIDDEIFIGVDKALREAVSQDYSPLIEKLKGGLIMSGAKDLSIAYSNMVASGMSADNAKAAVEAIAVEAGERGGEAFSKAMEENLFEATTVEEAVKNIIAPFRKSDEIYSELTKQNETRLAALTKEESSLVDLARARPFVAGSLPYLPSTSTSAALENAVLVTEEELSRLRQIREEMETITNDIVSLETVDPATLIPTVETLITAYSKAPGAVAKSLNEIQGYVTTLSLDDQKGYIDEINKFLSENYPEDYKKIKGQIDTATEATAALKLVTSGVNLNEAITDSGVFNSKLAESLYLSRSLADQYAVLAAESEVSFFTMIGDFAQKQRDQINLEFENFSNAMDTRIELYEGLKETAQETFEVEQKARQESVEGMQDEMEERREAFDEEMQRLDDRKNAIEKSSEAYIKSLEKNQKAESFYSQQRKTSFSALEKLASGDVFGFLQEREQMSADAQEYSYDQMITGIEERRDLELDAIDEVREQKQREQEEYEQMMEDRIQSVQDLMETEQEAHDERMKFYDDQIEGANTLRDKRLQAKDEEIDGIKNIEEDYRTDSQKAERTYGEKFTELKTKPYIEARKEMTKNAILSLYYQGGITLSDAASQAGITSGFGPSSITGQPFSMQEALSKLGITIPASSMFKEEETPGGVDTSALTQQVQDMTVDAEQVTLNGDINIEGGDIDNDPRTPIATGGYINNGRVERFEKGGGAVRGPGGPKSDVIPAMLSNGEYVIQASSVKKYGTDLMHTINSGKYADGGIVGYKVGGKVGGGGYTPSADRAEYNAKKKKKPTYFGGTPTSSAGYNKPSSYYRPPVSMGPRGGMALPSGASLADIKGAASMVGSFFSGIGSAIRDESVAFLSRFTSPFSFTGSSYGMYNANPNVGYVAPSVMTGRTQQEYGAYVRSGQRDMDAALFASNFLPLPGIPAAMAVAKAAKAMGIKILKPRTTVHAAGEFFPDTGTISTPAQYLPGIRNRKPRGWAEDEGSRSVDFSRGDAFWQQESSVDTRYYVSSGPGGVGGSPGAVAVVTKPTTTYEYPLVKSPAAHFLESIDSGIIGDVVTERAPGFSIDKITMGGARRSVAGEGPGGQLGLFDITHTSPQLTWLASHKDYSSYILSLLSNAGLSTKARFGETLFADRSLSPHSATIVDRLIGSNAFRMPSERTYNSANRADYVDYTVPNPISAAISGLKSGFNPISQTSPEMMRFFSVAGRQLLRSTAPERPVRFTLPFTGDTLEFKNKAELEIFLDQFNRIPFAKGGLVQKFADGGLVKSINKWFPRGGHQFYPGWNKFNSWAGGKPGIIMMHHTAGNWGQGELDYFAKDWVGRPVVQGFIRKTGTAHTLAGGATGYGSGEGDTELLNKVGLDQAAELISLAGDANRAAWQIEVQSLGKTKDFTSGQFDAIARMTAAIREYSGWNTFRGRIINHRDWAPGRKTDTLYPISVFERNAEKVWQEGSGETETNTGNRGQNRGGINVRKDDAPNIGDSSSSRAGFGKALARILGRAAIPTGQGSTNNDGGGGTPGRGINLNPNDYKDKIIQGYDLVKLIYGTGWTNKDDIRTAYGIVMGESGGDRTGRNYNAGGSAPGSTDWGLWQINDFYHKTAGDDKEKVDFGSRIMDAIYNSRIAYKIARSKENSQAFNGDQWGSWNAYRDKTTQYNLGLQTFDNNPNWWRQLVTETGGSNGGDSGGPVGTARSAVNFIRAQVGDSYVAGAGGPDSWDCSNLTAAAWNHAAQKQVLGVPSNVQANQITRRVVGLRDGQISGVMPGDVLYFAPNGVGSLPGHTSMYVGNGSVVEASSPSTGVRISSLNNSWNTGKGKFKWAGPPKNLRSGGFISGPGGPRSDSIPAMLSNGEYVVKASSVAKYGKGFMDKLNSGQLSLGGGGPVLQFANGGMVGGPPMPEYNLPQMSSPSFGLTNNNFGGSSNSSSNRTNVRVVINGAGGKSANAIASKVVSMINDANKRREHSRSI